MILIKRTFREGGISADKFMENLENGQTHSKTIALTQISVGNEIAGESELTRWRKHLSSVHGEFLFFS